MKTIINAILNTLRKSEPPTEVTVDDTVYYIDVPIQAQASTFSYERDNNEADSTELQ